MIVRRIVRGGIVCVEEDDDSLCLSYVRKKVSKTMSVCPTTRDRGTRRSTRSCRKINYDENINP